MALAAILFFGVPHGAIDHKIHLKFSKKSNVKKFILNLRLSRFRFFVVVGADALEGVVDLYYFVGLSFWPGAD